jgi:hypothetical protein
MKKILNLIFYLVQLQVCAQTYTYTITEILGQNKFCSSEFDENGNYKGLPTYLSFATYSVGGPGPYNMHKDGCNGNYQITGRGDIIINGKGAALESVSGDGIAIRTNISGNYSQLETALPYTVKIISTMTSTCITDNSQTHIYNGTINVTIISPPPPELSVSPKIVTVNNSAVTATAQTSYTPASIAIATNSCNSDFSRTCFFCGHDGSTTNPRVANFQANGGVTFISAQSAYKGCISKPAKPVEVVLKPNVPTSTCNIGEIDENGYFKNRSDYHEYFNVTEICDKSESGCTVQNLYTLMKSDYRNTAPQTSDMYPFKTLTTLGEKMSSNQIGEPSSNCKRVNLLVPLSWLSSSIIPKAVLPCLTNAGNYYGEPIVQTVDDNSNSISNLTLPGHPLHPGKVINTIFESGCKVYIKSIGMGNSKAYECAHWAGNSMAWINQRWGLSIFQNIAGRLKNSYNKNK